MRVRFWKFSTAGNTTLFTDPAGTAAQALTIIGAEQAGCVDLVTNTLIMAGGEFCANACLAFAALLALRRLPVGAMTIAGQNVSLEIDGRFPDWRCAARFSMPDYEIEETAAGPLCHLGAISHKLIECNTFPDAPMALQMASALAEECANPAAGAIFWRGADKEYEILPAVAVPRAGTCNLEQACGSGSIALAVLRPARRLRIRQPSGEVLEIQKDNSTVLVSGRVQYQASGELWLHGPIHAAANQLKAEKRRDDG